MQVSLNEQIAVVQAYITHRTDKDITINMQQFADVFNVMKLAQAYNFAVQWFQSNNGTVNYLR